MKQLFSVRRAKAYIFRLVHSGTDFTVKDITDRYDITASQVHKLCKAHIGNFGKTAICDRRIELLANGTYRSYGHHGYKVIFPISNEPNPLLTESALLPIPQDRLVPPS